MRALEFAHQVFCHFQVNENHLFGPDLGASLVAQMVKKLPAVLKTRVQSLGREDPLEKEMATHSILLPGELHGQRSLVGPVRGFAKRRQD